jgi:hypothetical protein
MSNEKLSREYIRGVLKRSWGQTIKNYYNRALINSERALQHYFCLELDKKLKSNQSKSSSIKYYIEPTIIGGANFSRIPDLIICNAKYIISVIEFKYIPRFVNGRNSEANQEGFNSGIEKDMETLSLMKNIECIKYYNERYVGVENGTKTLQIADDAVLCWAGVYGGEEMAAPDDLNKCNKYLQMSAITEMGKEAKIVCR